MIRRFMIRRFMNRTLMGAAFAAIPVPANAARDLIASIPATYEDLNNHTAGPLEVTNAG
jgi:hypothetical protein